ncbi:gamma carbonic anhydrase family protein [Tropicimonas marinistellae]|uniref:gamma carbonic anhydrase family protein n=1 Tax=Tropicimonas marinistellae TaxID=1739787 RepID=UPI00082D449B|nr:gamma carbonic anhydrase family protein [Tropicimonas marinistellae]
MPICSLGNVAPTCPQEETWVAPNAYVIGNVTLGRDVGVWFAATIRGDNEPIVIGNRTNIQEGSVLHSDPGSPLTIGSDVTIGHRAIVHGCTIGDNTLVGMGATILNKARIGKNCIIGANALVTEGKAFPDFSLIVGAPAKAVRVLGPEAEEELKASAKTYVGNLRRFRAEFTPG